MHTSEVIRRFNDAFQKHDPDLLTDLVAADCVIENTGPAPDGSRHEGRAACLAVWQPLAANPEIFFELEDVFVAGDRATVRWRLRFGDGDANSVRGVNLHRVQDGQIVESMGYVKA